MKLKAIFFIFISLSFYRLAAQPQLALLKNDKLITRFEEGEYIRFQRKGDKGFIRAIITGIHPGFFIVGGDTVYTYAVAKIDVSNKILTNYKVAPIGKGLMQAGVLLITADLFNKTVILDKKYRIDNPVTGVAITLVGVGGFVQVVNNNYFKLGRKKKLATINLR